MWRHGRLDARRWRRFEADFDAAGELIGIAITVPSLVSVASLNAVLADHGAEAIEAAELDPIAA